MTEIRRHHPNYIPTIELTDEGREISFKRECLGEVEIFRKVNDGDWELLIKGVRTPYMDEESFPPSTKLAYSVQIQEDSKKKKYNLEVKL